MKVLILLALGLLSGCATTGKEVAENMTDIPEGRGIALFSTGAFSTSTSFVISLRLVNGAVLKKYDAVNIMLNSAFKSTDIEGEYTNIRTMDLPVGKYYLYAYSVNYYYSVLDSPIYEFEIRDKEVVYIGNFYLENDSIHWSLNERDRDIRFFTDKNPKLKDIIIESQNVLVGPDFKGIDIDGVIWGKP